MHVEPMLSMEGLVRAALKHGMVPKVVAPFRDVTVGGAVSERATGVACVHTQACSTPTPAHSESCKLRGAKPYVRAAAGALTTSVYMCVGVGSQIAGGVVSSASHRHGLFHEACSYIEVALGNGTLVNCSRVGHHHHDE